MIACPVKRENGHVFDFITIAFCLTVFETPVVFLKAWVLHIMVIFLIALISLW